jgi:two-component system, chemotaxis family, chemotaxis protein CheY
MANKKVLVVDDSPTIRSIVQIYLMGRPLEFIEAADGERGLQLARLLGVDLVIADVKMPKMDGFTLARTLRAEPGPVRRVPIILLTGNAAAREAEALECGASAFVRKPVTSSDLVRVVTSLVPEAGS